MTTHDAQKPCAEGVHRHGRVVSLRDDGAHGSKRTGVIFVVAFGLQVGREDFAKVDLELYQVPILDFYIPIYFPVSMVF
jgi:hypothetical protein